LYKGKHQKNSKKGKSRRVSKAYLWIKTDALDHKKRAPRDKIIKWQIRVMRWYSINSKKTHKAVPAPSAIPVNFLFLHSKISAAAKENVHNVIMQQRK
jgi:hypothetical protein